jgi:hypothetical protein
MATLKEIRARLRQLGLENEYGYRAEAKLIPRALEGDEELLQITSGVREGQRWLLIVTARRLVLLSKPTMGSPNVIAIPREDLRTVRGRRGLLFGSLTLETGTDTYSFSNVLKKSLPGFLEELQSSAQ